MTRYDKTRLINEQVEEQGLSELRDAYINAIELSGDYWSFREFRNTVDVGNPSFADISKRYYQMKEAYAGALALAEVIAKEKAAQNVSRED